MENNGKPDPIEAHLPEAMADLMSDYIARKDVDSRAQIRTRMKALLDYVSANTEYPPNPILRKDETAQPAREAAMQGIARPYLGTGNGMGAMTPVVAIPEPAPIAGARRVDNSEILG